MSVEYYLVCKKHSERAWVCSDGMSGPQSQNEKPASAFIITHRNCCLTVIDEHDELHDHFTEWNAEDWEDRFRYDL
jgi:hypothetical protein